VETPDLKRVPAYKHVT